MPGEGPDEEAGLEIPEPQRLVLVAGDGPSAVWTERDRHHPGPGLHVLQQLPRLHVVELETPFHTSNTTVIATNQTGAAIGAQGHAFRPQSLDCEAPGMHALLQIPQSKRAAMFTVSPQIS